ncbi:uncharacterized protein LOC121051300 [Rosa chinensis]|uniref:uncharacterized protein LOC121051300 n=1 Tax=Rosa chinensis TaxID=74649 RepID=UPI001AD8C313|nr:uncharacterized protein LOC121051300 [Rosa chinensis]
MADQEPAPQVPEVGADLNAAPAQVAAPIVEPPAGPAAAVNVEIIAEVPPPTPPNRLERLVRILEVAPPGVADEARDNLQRLLGPDILLPGAAARAQEYLMVLRRERTITEDEFVETYDLLQNLPARINERTTAAAQFRQVQAHYRGLAQQAEASRDSLGDQALCVRDLRISQNHLRTHIQGLQAQLVEAEAQLVTVTAQLAQEEPQIEQPLTALEAMSQNLAQARDTVRLAERAAADASFRLDEHLLRLTHAGRKLYASCFRPILLCIRICFLIHTTFSPLCSAQILFRVYQLMTNKTVERIIPFWAVASLETVLLPTRFQYLPFLR